MGNVKLLDGRVPEDKKGEARPFASSKLAVLRKHPYFCDLDPEAFDQLCRYAKHATLKRGATIFSKGDPGTSLIAAIPRHLARATQGGLHIAPLPFHVPISIDMYWSARTAKSGLHKWARGLLAEVAKQSAIAAR